jgi:hypothetical protein
MAGTEWPFTGLGRQFFDGTLPQLVRNVGRLADELKRHNDGVIPASGKEVEVFCEVLEAARGAVEDSIRGEQPLGMAIVPLRRIEALKDALAKWEQK